MKIRHYSRNLSSQSKFSCMVYLNGTFLYVIVWICHILFVESAKIVT
jgi:hypothetical protein